MSGLNFKEIISDHICDECGKKFTFFGMGKDYLYKRLYRNKQLYFCSDKCKRSFEDKRNLKCGR